MAETDMKVQLRNRSAAGRVLYVEGILANRQICSDCLASKVDAVHKKNWKWQENKDNQGQPVESR